MNKIEQEIADWLTGKITADSRQCCECGDMFEQRAENQIRCTYCNAVKHS
jgi:hypothetical protein